METAGHLWPEGWIRGYGWAPVVPESAADEPEVEPIPFRDYALTFVASLSGTEERTRHDYERDLRNHILPTFGDLDIRDGNAIDRTLVRTWVNTLQHGVADPANAKQWLRRPPAPKTIQNLHGILFAILQDAVEAHQSLHKTRRGSVLRLLQVMRRARWEWIRR
ncbi:hypothetical protein [Microbispora rosea]|uniref:hypothetical protein n=1 Tax=Microbispora rosea TaxID=58117 RepID=UPI003418AA53